MLQYILCYNGLHELQSVIMNIVLKWMVCITVNDRFLYMVLQLWWKFIYKCLVNVGCVFQLVHLMSINKTEWIYLTLESLSV